MKCPHCHHLDSRVVESREAGDGDAIRRRRECLDCQYRYTTYERIERPNLAVIKKDGSRELFDRQKLFAAIHRSVGKFLTSNLEIEEIVAKVENELYGMGVQEVPSRRIGDLVLEELGRRNEVAYVRFASVYREFKDVSEFQAVLDDLKLRHDESGTSAQS
ncbi:MAG: transcriptional repressor NrdR [Candidatus Chaera renei]|uniref:Transcriptional repressor NrdR n=1 Tax=Candidatus Chaera renei TaxID=2506947 RepID=A0A4Q0AKE2_9BACT|nr:MAG: transcriptional repressor NrdR [Candidatus Chaera renei]